MKLKLTAVIFAAAVLLTACNSNTNPAEKIVETAPSNFEYSENSDGTVTITGYKGSSLRIGIPEKIDGKIVSAIGQNAFNGYDDKNEVENSNASIIAVNIPDTVKRIENGAFANDFKLKYVKLSANLEVLSESAFASCSILENVEIPKTVTEIGSYAFYKCDGLTEAVIPDSVEKIGEAAYACSDSIVKVQLSENIDSIPDYLFYECDALKDINLPAEITEIGEGAFAWTAVEKIEIPDKTASIGDGAFFSCMNLKEIIIPESVKAISNESVGYTHDDNNNSVTIENLVIKGKKQSEAENYANENKITFEEIQND